MLSDNNVTKITIICNNIITVNGAEISSQFEQTVLKFLFNVKELKKNHVKWAENDRLRMWFKLEREIDERLIRTLLN